MGYYDDFLEHHGILGMKWGKKSGPPYPLSAQTHNAVTSKASEEERKAAAQRGGGSAASLHTQNAGKKIDLSKIDKEKAKKIAKGVAIGAGVAAGVGATVVAGKAIASNPRAARLLAQYGKEQTAALSKKVGKAMGLAALNAVGDILVVKILKKLEPKEGATEAEKDAAYVAKKTVKAGLDAARGRGSIAPDTSNNQNSSKNKNLKVDKNSKAYQQLFDQSLTDEERKTIKQKANDGATIEELQEYKRSLKHSSIIEWAESFSYYD